MLAARRVQRLTRPPHHAARPGPPQSDQCPDRTGQHPRPGQRGITGGPHQRRAAPAATGGHACSLITETDVTNAVRTDPGKGSPFSSHSATQCQYGSFPKQLLLVNVLPTHGKASYARVRHDPRLPSGNGTSVTTISGLADQGFELSAPHTDAIYFTKGDVLIVVSFSTRSSPPKGAALTLAHIAAGRL